MNNPAKSEFYTFRASTKGMEGDQKFWSLNVSGARQVVLSARGSKNCFVTNYPKDVVLDNVGDPTNDFPVMIIPDINTNMAPLVISSNDEYLNVGVFSSKDSEIIHVWVIR